jgi:hypothetical protein
MAERYTGLPRSLHSRVTTSLVTVARNQLRCHPVAGPLPQHTADTASPIDGPAPHHWRVSPFWFARYDTCLE